MAAITKTFHDHIRLSNIDGHGIKQILYPETTSDDIIMPDGKKLTKYLTEMTDDIEFVKPASTATAKGIKFVDPENNDFYGIIQNSSNLWIGATETASYHHNGFTHISSGWKTIDGVFTPNESVFIAVPKDTDNDGIPDNADNYNILHVGNYSKYAIPLAGSLEVTGSIGMASTSKGYLLHDGKQQYPGLFNNGDNLWIGAASKNSYHHYGMTLISAGWHATTYKYEASAQATDGSMMVLDKDYSSSESARTIGFIADGRYQRFTLPANKRGVAIDTVKVGLPTAYYGDWVVKTDEQTGVESNETLYVSLPEYDPASPDAPTTAINRAILHTGNSGFYNLNFTRGRGITAMDSSDNMYYAFCDNGTNLWIGAHATTSRHHVGKTYISSGWEFDSTLHSNSVPYRSIYISVPNVSTLISDSAEQSGGKNYEVIHSGIINEYLENNIGYGLSSTDQMITTYKNINSTDYVPLDGAWDTNNKVKDVGLIKNSGANFWIGCDKAESYHHYGQVLISTGWRYKELLSDADVNITDALDSTDYQDLWNAKFSPSGAYFSNAAYLAPYETIKISVPKYDPSSSFAGEGTYQTETEGSSTYYRGVSQYPMVPNNCDNYDALHKGNFQSWFLSFCSSHASQIKSALGIS